jgi:molybdopterin-binding protein
MLGLLCPPGNQTFPTCAGQGCAPGPFSAPLSRRHEKRDDLVFISFRDLQCRAWLPLSPEDAWRLHHKTLNARRTQMKVSARNLIPGTIKNITIGMVNAEVVIEVAPGVEVVSVITKHSVENMGLAVGSKVKAMVKASSVMVVTD